MENNMLSFRVNLYVNGLEFTDSVQEFEVSTEEVELLRKNREAGITFSQVKELEDLYEAVLQAFVNKATKEELEENAEDVLSDFYPEWEDEYDSPEDAIADGVLEDWDISENYRITVDYPDEF